MDILIKTRVENWAKSAGFSELELEKQFELYATGIYLHSELPSTHVLPQIALGDGTDGGVDAAAVIVNGVVVTEDDNLEDLLSKGNGNRIELFFLQAKTSTSTSMKDIDRFLGGIELICGSAYNTEQYTAPARWTWISELLGTAIKNADRFSTEKFGFSAIFVTTAKDSSANNIKQDMHVQATVRRIEELNLFESPLNFFAHGKQELFKTANELTGPQDVKFNLPKRVSIPTTNEIDEAVIGVIDGASLKTLLMENGGQRRHIFDANVRLYQGRDNEVNQRIRGTLYSPDKIHEFPFLNNGLTVVANKMDIKGDQVMLSGYHIVNGGQTSVEIINWLKEQTTTPDQNSGESSELLKPLQVPLKIIASGNAEIRASITVATNLQTAIGDVDIQASSSVAHQVEEYFQTTGNHGLRYQRQSSSESIDFVQLRVFDTESINRAMEACIFGNSSRATGTPKELRDQRNPIWWGDIPLPAFYFAAWIMYRVDSYFNRTKDKRTFAVRAARYHIAMITSVVTIPELKKTFKVFSSSSTGSTSTVQGAIKGLKKIKVFNKDSELSSQMLETIETNIDKAIEITKDYFEDALQSGDHLRKDHVRSKTVQNDLLERIDHV